MRRSLRPVLAAAGISAFTLVVLGSLGPGPAMECRSGLVYRDVFDLAHDLRPELSDAQIAQIAVKTGPGLCVPPELPKSFAAHELKEERMSGVRDGVTPEVYRRAVERKQTMIAAGATSTVPNASGTWEPYGRGPLVVNDIHYGRVNGLGLVFNSGRVDSMDYDAVNNRLFATIGTGGVWMSQAATVEELGDDWVSIGDTLPNQAIGAVAWSTAGGGTLIVGGGEPLFMAGGAYDGLGAFWSDDLGATWNQATGDIPDGIITFQVAVDKSDQQIVYIATSKGLFRSIDAGHSFTNVALPTSVDCAGSTSVTTKCFYANVVTDVVVKAPGGSTSVVCTPLVAGAGGCPVLAAVGYQRSNAMSYENGEPLAPGNGLYRSTTGAPGTFTKLNASGDGTTNIGFPPQQRIGRTELSGVDAPTQNHEYVYAIVQDAVLLAGGIRGLDMPSDVSNEVGAVPTSTYISGIYISSDFGASWLRAADTAEIANNPNSGSSFVASQAIQSPGIQAWYDEWIKVDPTRTNASGVPMRVLFGLEEVWQNRFTNLPQDGITQSGNNDYKVVGTYFAGESCQFPLGVGGDAVCPTRDPDSATGYVTTTHPDQHEGIFVPRTNGGVCAFVGNDGGVYRQCVDANVEFSQSNWGDGVNKGFYSLLPYHMAVAKDGTVWFGLQDNGSGRIDKRSRRIYETIGGDGFFVAVDPDNGQIAYSERPYADLAVTVDGGITWTDIPPPAAVTDNAQFSTPLAMDPLDANHLMTAGRSIAETLDGPDTSSWTVVFDMGTNPDNSQARAMTALDLHGDAAYVGACGNCNRSVRVDLGFQKWLATNVGGSAPPAKGTTAGWHLATAAGLPDRYITGIEIDPGDPNTIYLTLGGYGGAQYLPPGRYLDPNTNIGTGNVFKSTDAGESFTDITGDLPELPVLWVTQLGTQLMVGTDIGAFISTDLDGTQWAPMGVTLPAAPVSSLHAHPGNADLILASTFGRGIWCYSISADPEACDPIPELQAPVQADPANVEQAPGAAACGTDTNGTYTLGFSYTPLAVDDALPDGFQVQEATLFQDIFTDDASEALSNGSNSRWQQGGGSTTGVDGWTSQVNPNTGNLAYYVPDTLEQSWTLAMKDPVSLSPGGGTLTFDTTQATEEGFDYGSVEISTDDFATYTTIASDSGIFIGQRQVDLTDYGGQQIKLRFRMTSDGNTGLTGWYVENIVINTNNFAAIAQLPANAVSHALSGVNDGTRYYRIAGTITVGAVTATGPYSNVKCATVAIPNLPPIANAGIDFVLNEGAGALLSGAGSSDPENGALTYAWTQTAGPTVTLSGANTATPSFTAPQVAMATDVVLELTVTDVGGLSDVDEVIITVNDLGNPAVNVGDNHVGGGLPPLTLLLLTGLALLRRRPPAPGRFQALG